MEKVKEEKGVKLDTELEVEDLKKLVSLFKAAVKERTGKDFPESPWEQLWGAVCAVFDSWMNERAILYRRMNQIPEEWGTAAVSYTHLASYIPIFPLNFQNPNKP